MFLYGKTVEILRIVLFAIGFFIANIFTLHILCNLNLFAFHFATYTYTIATSNMWNIFLFMHY